MARRLCIDKAALPWATGLSHTKQASLLVWPRHSAQAVPEEALADIMEEGMVRGVLALRANIGDDGALSATVALESSSPSLSYSRRPSATLCFGFPPASPPAQPVGAAAVDASRVEVGSGGVELCARLVVWAPTPAPPPIPLVAPSSARPPILEVHRGWGEVGRGGAVCRWSDARMGRDRQAPPPGNRASGMRWRKTDPTKPVAGAEIVDERLASSLAGKAEVRGEKSISEAEWVALGIEDLRLDHFVKVGALYFRPVDGAHTRVADIKECLYHCCAQPLCRGIQFWGQGERVGECRLCGIPPIDHHLLPVLPRATDGAMTINRLGSVGHALYEPDTLATSSGTSQGQPITSTRLSWPPVAPPSPSPPRAITSTDALGCGPLQLGGLGAEGLGTLPAMGDSVMSSGHATMGGYASTGRITAHVRLEGGVGGSSLLLGLREVPQLPFLRTTPLRSPPSPPPPPRPRHKVSSHEYRGPMGMAAHNAATRGTATGQGGVPTAFASSSYGDEDEPSILGAGVSGAEVNSWLDRHHLPGSGWDLRSRLRLITGVSLTTAGVVLTCLAILVQKCRHQVRRRGGIRGAIRADETWDAVGGSDSEGQQWRDASAGSLTARADSMIGEADVWGEQHGEHVTGAGVAWGSEGVLADQGDAWGGAEGVEYYGKGNACGRYGGEDTCGSRFTNGVANPASGWYPVPMHPTVRQRPHPDQTSSLVGGQRNAEAWQGEESASSDGWWETTSEDQSSVSDAMVDTNFVSEHTISEDCDWERHMNDQTRRRAQFAWAHSEPPSTRLWSAT